MKHYYYLDFTKIYWVCPCDVMAKVTVCVLEVNKFKILLRDYIHLENPYPPCYVLNSITAVFQQGWLLQDNSETI